MAKDICIDIIFENSIELPKAAKTEDLIIYVDYKLKNSKVYVKDSIIDIESTLNITTVYKAVDHTVRWNEQLVTISGSKIIPYIEEKNIYKSECVCIQRIKEYIKSPNIYYQQIYACFKINEQQDFFNIRCKDNRNNNIKSGKTFEAW